MHKFLFICTADEYFKISFQSKIYDFFVFCVYRKTNIIDDDSIKKAKNQNTKESPLIGRFFANSHIHFKYRKVWHVLPWSLYQKLVIPAIQNVISSTDHRQC